MDRTATKILIADGDSDSRASLMWVLLAGGFWVEPISNGLDVAPALEADLPHVAIIDLYLPGFSGRHLIERMRSTERLRDVPILAIAKERPWAALPPGVAFLCKPCDPQALLDTVEDLARGGAGTMVSMTRPSVTARALVADGRALGRSR